MSTSIEALPAHSRIATHQAGRKNVHLRIWAGTTRGQVMATHNGILVGQLVVLKGVIVGVEVRSDFQRQGLASAMHAELASQLSFRHANTRTRAGNAWSKTLPDYKKAGRLIEKLSEPQLS